MGIVFCCLYFLLLGVLGIHRSRKKIYTHVKYQTDRFNHFKSETEIIFNDEMVTYRNFERYLELKWSCFYHYSFSNGILMLALTMEATNGINVHNQDFEKEQFGELMKLVQSKVSKRIK
jgi:hypothetical protein